jgi:hypothetical protein
MAQKGTSSFFCSSQRNWNLILPPAFQNVEVLQALYNNEDDTAAADYTKQLAATVAKNHGNFFYYSREQPRSK